MRKTLRLPLPPHSRPGLGPPRRLSWLLITAGSGAARLQPQSLVRSPHSQHRGQPGRRALGGHTAAPWVLLLKETPTTALLAPPHWPEPLSLWYRLSGQSESRPVLVLW